MHIYENEIKSQFIDRKTLTKISSIFSVIIFNVNLSHQRLHDRSDNELANRFLRDTTYR